MLYKAGVTDAQHFNGQTIGSFGFTLINFEGGTIGVLKKITLKLSLERDGKKFELMSISALAAACRAGVQYRGSLAVLSGFKHNGNRFLAFKIHLPCPINLKGKDILTIQVINNSTKDVEVKPFNAVGYEIGLPKIGYQYAISGASEKEYVLGDHINEIIIADLDHNDGDFTALTITSDYLKEEMTYNQLLSTIAETADVNYGLISKVSVNQGSEAVLYRDTIPKTVDLGFLPNVTDDGDLTPVLIAPVYQGDPITGCRVKYEYATGSDLKMIIYSSIEMSIEHLQKAEQRRAKHEKEHVLKLPHSHTK